MKYEFILKTISGEFIRYRRVHPKEFDTTLRSFKAIKTAYENAGDIVELQVNQLDENGNFDKVVL